MRLKFLRTFLPAVFVYLIGFGTLPACAQYSVDKVVIEGGAPYSEAELLDVAALHPGQMMTRTSLQTAAQHLLDTGVFDDAEVFLSGAGKARTVHFSLKPTPLAKMMLPSFVNLVWWTPEELARGIHARVLLYRGRMPDAGNLPDSVQEALVQMLAAKGITASVSHQTIEPTTQHPVRVVEFRIDKPSVRVQSATLEGAPAELAKGMQRAAASAVGSLYNEGLSGGTMEDRLLGPLRNAGYVAAKLDEVKREPIVTATGVAVVYTAHVQPGEAYKVAAITWSATPVYSADAFARDAKMHVGDVASERALQMTAQQIVAAYRAKGYLDAFIDPAPKFDDAAHTVVYALNVHMGEQYRLHSLTATNLSPEARRDFEAGWMMKPGDIYDALYVSEFLHKNLEQRNLAGYSAGFEVSADPIKHEVDLTINFVLTKDGK